MLQAAAAKTEMQAGVQNSKYDLLLSCKEVKTFNNGYL